MAFKFDENHYSLVIGSNGTIGSACKDALCFAGSKVILMDYSLPKIKLPNQFLKCDVTNIEDVKNSAKQIEKIDSIIYAVGLNYDAKVVDTNWAEYRKLMSVNLDGAFHIGSVFGKKMISQKKGSFIFLSSFAGIRGEAGASVYSASKFGLIGFVESFAAEMTSFNVRVNAICPGNVDSPMLKKVAKDIAKRSKSSTPKIYNQMKNSGAAKRLVNPDEVANLAVYLSSKLSTGITGSVIKIDCGAGVDG